MKFLGSFVGLLKTSAWVAYRSADKAITPITQPS